MHTLCIVLALVTKEDMELVQMDVKTVFLHGNLHEDIYMQQQEDFIVPTLRTVLVSVTKEDMELVQMDVKTAFLHSNLHEDIYLYATIRGFYSARQGKFGM